MTPRGPQYRAILIDPGNKTEERALQTFGVSRHLGRRRRLGVSGSRTEIGSHQQSAGRKDPRAHPEGQRAKVTPTLPGMSGKRWTTRSLPRK